MTQPKLHISFHANKYDGKIPNLESGIHLVLTDHCYHDIAKRLTSLSDEDVAQLREARIAFVSTTRVDPEFDSHGEWLVHCPVNDQHNYVLTRKEYNEAYQKFIRGS